MFKQMKVILSLIIFIAFVSPSDLIFAQDNIDISKINFNKNISENNDDFAAKHAKDLQNRLGLTDDQTKQVANILMEYRNNVQNSNPDNTIMQTPGDPQQAANDKIIALLDENQKAAFAQIEGEWWASVSKDAGTVNRKNPNDSY